MVTMHAFTGSHGAIGSTGSSGAIGATGATGAAIVHILSAKRRVARQAGCPGTFRISLSACPNVTIPSYSN